MHKEFLRHIFVCLVDINRQCGTSGITQVHFVNTPYFTLSDENVYNCS